MRNETARESSVLVVKGELEKLKIVKRSLDLEGYDVYIADGSVSGKMASGMTHEINNPLAAVIGFSDDLLLGREIPAEIRGDVEAINIAAQRVANMLKRMPTLARQYALGKKHISNVEILEEMWNRR